MTVIDLEKLEVNGYNELERALTVTVLDEIITPSVRKFDDKSLAVIYRYKNFYHSKVYKVDELNQRTNNSLETILSEIAGEANYKLRKVIDWR